MTATATPVTPARRFQLLERLGQGAFGEVFLAELHSGGGFRRKVVLKLLHAEVAALPGAEGRMRDEARVLGLLSHRNIVAVHDLLHLDDGSGGPARWAIQMDPVPGADLERILATLHGGGEPCSSSASRPAAFPVSAALEVGAAMCDALDYAARAEDGTGRLAVVHRDIKPSNVHLTAEGEVKVLDFGIARFSLQGREASTRAGAWVGTELYMAPERLASLGDTEAGDVYAAAATVYELIVGQPLGRTPLLPDLHAAWVASALGAARTAIGPRATDAVVDALAGALAADPAARPTARELHVAFAALADALGPSLEAFARECVPRVLAQRPPEPASGVLVERVDAPGSTVRAGPAGADGLLPVLSATVASVSALACVGVGTAALLAMALLRPDARSADPPQQRRAPEPVAAEAREPPTPADPIPPTAAPDPAPGPARAERPRAVDPEPRTAAPEVRVDRAMVTVRDASRVEVTCRDVRTDGTASVRIMDFPPGSCTVEAAWLGGTYATELRIDHAGSYTCRVEQGTLQCSG